MSYASRVYRQRNAHTLDEPKKEPFFAKQKDVHQPGPFFQTKLTVNQPGDSYEQEADSVANAVVNRTTKSPVVQHKKITSIQRLSTPVEDEKLATNDARMAKDKEIQEKPIQRMARDPEKEKLAGIQKSALPEEDKKEAVQKKESPDAKEEEKMNVEAIQTKPAENTTTASPQIDSKLESSSGKGNGLPAKTNKEMSSSFGVDFSHVRIHKDSEAVSMNNELEAQAFTRGKDIYFNKGKYDPDTNEGKLLLAHELTHVVQQGEARINKKELGSKFSHGTAKPSPYKIISAEFDGRDFHLFGDKTELMKVAADSGRPYSVKAKDAKDCKGSTVESYKNNPKYVGVRDNGPIPEGTYAFKAIQMAVFSTTDQMEMIKGGHYTDPFGASLHGGDWGAGRVPLSPLKILPGPKGCGDTSKRSGFFLHGGSLPGSSGCIDIGNAAIGNLVNHLKGYRGKIMVTVKYKFPAPTVGTLERVLGRVTYPGQENPTLLDRIKAGISDE